MTTKNIDFLRCRSFGHSWEEFLATDMNKPLFGVRVSTVCTSCGTKRHDLLNTHGEVEQREYRYPDGYQHNGGTPLKRADYKLLYLRSRKKRALKRDSYL